MYPGNFTLYEESSQTAYEELKPNRNEKPKFTCDCSQTAYEELKPRAIYNEDAQS